ncbi:hypothetical protein PMZ80_002883 [Knufia obscura]|uniref:Cation/H+ exchanger transmembrane domain-containing protein n=1 Tax=Knufia obscura TaxID=1635080 RepID=A0ABR0RYL3_9EURO|nr:hypothetical protein PMZ80_002883 [Knufia obscura]
MAGLNDIVLGMSELNVVIAIFGFFILAYGFISVKIKTAWYLGEACEHSNPSLPVSPLLTPIEVPAVAFGVLLGPLATRWLDSRKWGEAIIGQQPAITLGMCRLVIGVQLVIAGFQLPARYGQYRWKELLVCLLPIMTIMWLCTTACVMATIPKITLLAGLVIGSCVTCTDPILSQAVAKGPFSDKYVRRNLREIISAEAGANDGFGFPFLMLAVYLIRFAESEQLTAEIKAASQEGSIAERALSIATRVSSLLLKRAEGSEAVGRLGGGVSRALGTWTLTTWGYVVLMSIVYGALFGYLTMWAAKLALKKRWIDSESYLLIPTGMSLFLLGTCGILGTDDLLSCFVAGNALNWNGQYLLETEKRHDEYNSIIDVLLNFGGFMYIGTIIPWRQFHDPDGTGLTIPRLIGLGVLIVLFRRIPAIFAVYKFGLRRCVTDWKEALFMGYFGPIGIGAVFYVEHTRHLFPEEGTALTKEENDLVRAMIPVVYWLVLFSIVWHGLSIPALNLFYVYMGVQPVEDEDGPVEVGQLSEGDTVPGNVVSGSRDAKRGSVLVRNRFSRGYNAAEVDLNGVEDWRRKTQRWSSIELGYGDDGEGRRRTIKWDSERYQSDLRGTRIKKVGEDGKGGLEGGRAAQALSRPVMGGVQPI